MCNSPDLRSLPEAAIRSTPMQPSQIVLLVAAALFGVYLFVMFRPGGGRARRKLDAPIREARSRAHRAKTPDAKAEALAEAGEAAANAKRWVAAAGYFLRAMRTVPASEQIVKRAATALLQRPQLAETTFWRRIAALPDDEAHRGAFVASVRALAALYEGPMPDRGRAKALRRLAKLEDATKPDDAAV